MLMRILLTGLCVLLWSTSALSFTIEDAVKAAIQNHQLIMQAQAGVDLAQADVDATRSAFLPRLDLSYRYINRDRDPFSSGSEGSTLAATGAINLFNGWQDQHTHTASKARAQAAKFKLRAAIADVALATRRAYIEILRADKTVNTAVDGVALLEQQRQDAQHQFDYGIIARNDLLRIDVELSGARQQQLAAQGQMRIARHRLERLTGQPLGTKNLTEQSLKHMAWTAGKDVYAEEMLAHRSELNYLKQQVQAAEYHLKANRNHFWPDLELSLSHERYGDSVSPDGLPDVADYDNKLLLAAQWNLFDGFSSRSKTRTSAAMLRDASAQLKDAKDELLLQLQTVLEETAIAEGNLREARSGVEQAAENYRVTQNRFQQQQATTVDLLDAQFLLTRARNLKVNAHYDLYLATAVLERILERQPETDQTP